MLRRASILAIMFAGCSPDGDYIDACTSCGPGALVEGRFFESTFCNANANGVIVCTSSCRPIVYFLDSGLATVERVQTGPLDQLVSCSGPAINAGGETVSLEGSNSLAIVHADRSIDHLSIGVRLDTANPIVFGDNLIGVMMHSGGLVAISPTTGATRWSLTSPDVAALSAGFSGGLVVGGQFTGTLDLGGMTQPFVWGPTPAGWVGRFDDDGIAAWAQPVIGTTSAKVDHVAVGPHGEIAILASWKGDGAIGNVNLGAKGQTVALFDPAGALQWHFELGVAATSLVTDGVDVYLARPEAVMRVGATGIVWALGPNLDPTVFAVMGDTVLASFDSTFDPVGSVSATFTYGDVAVDLGAQGNVIAELAR